MTASIRIGFLGAGFMAQTISKGLRKSGIVDIGRISASDVNENTLLKAKKEGLQVAADNKTLVQQSDVIFLAVKPSNCMEVLQDVRQHLNQEKLVVSIAAGISLKRLEEASPPGTRIVRVMPNIACLVQAGTSVFSPGQHATPDDCHTVQRLMSSTGMCEEVVEEMIDVSTGLSAGGPAFMFMAIEALADAGVKHGLTRQFSQKLAANTVLGAARLVLETGTHPGQLKDQVCSPGGSTIEGVHALEKSAFRAALIDAVAAAIRKTKLLVK